MSKAKKYSLWWMAALTAATFLLSIPLNVEGILCNSCMHITKGNTGGTSRHNQNENLLSTPLCAKSHSLNLEFCDGHCYTNIYNDGEGTAYHRDCAHAPHDLGCKKYSTGDLTCYCDSTLCNNHTLPAPKSHELRSSECSIVVTAGSLIVLYSM